MKRSPALILVAALAMAALTARLGWWQLDRAAQKTERQATLDERRRLPPLDGADLARTAVVLESQVYRRTVARGRWDAPRTVFLENRAMQSRAGFIVVTPLLLDDGRAVLVQRGWIPRDPADRLRVQMPPTPAGPVEVRGTIAPPPTRLYEFDGSASGPVRQNLDIESFAAETRLALVPLSILQAEDPAGVAGPSAGDGLLRQWPAPAFGVHKHYGYAAQWFALSALTIGLYVWFRILRPWRLRRAA
jgi:surfeit locus 1 family protein